MTKEQEKQFFKEQKRVFDWMFKVQEERLKQRGYSCDDNGQRTLVIDLSCNKEQKRMNMEQEDKKGKLESCE